MTDVLKAAYCNSPKAYKKSPNTMEETKVIKNNTEGPFFGLVEKIENYRYELLVFHSQSQPASILVLIQFNTSINDLEKGEKGEEQNLQTTAELEKLQKHSIKSLCNERALKFKGELIGTKNRKKPHRYRLASTIR